MEDRYLIASTGKWLTNGEIYAAEVWLGNWDSPSNWYEVDIEEIQE